MFKSNFPPEPLPGLLGRRKADALGQRGRGRPRPQCGTGVLARQIGENGLEILVVICFSFPEPVRARLFLKAWLRRASKDTFAIELLARITPRDGNLEQAASLIMAVAMLEDKNEARWIAAEPLYRSLGQQEGYFRALETRSADAWELSPLPSITLIRALERDGKLEEAADLVLRRNRRAFCFRFFPWGAQNFLLLPYNPFFVGKDRNKIFTSYMNCFFFRLIVCADRFV
jgi:hypothetical protein